VQRRRRGQRATAAAASGAGRGKCSSTHADRTHASYQRARGAGRQQTSMLRTAKPANVENSGQSSAPLRRARRQTRPSPPPLSTALTVKPRCISRLHRQPARTGAATPTPETPASLRRRSQWRWQWQWQWRRETCGSLRSPDRRSRSQRTGREGGRSDRGRAGPAAPALVLSLCRLVTCAALALAAPARRSSIRSRPVNPVNFSDRARVRGTAEGRARAAEGWPRFGWRRPASLSPRPPVAAPIARAA